MTGIGMMMMAMKSGVVSPLPLVDVAAVSVAPGTAAAVATFNNDGTISRSVGAGLSWNVPSPLAGVGGGYWIRCTLNSGTSPNGDALGSWLALSSARSWSLTQSTIGSKSCNCTIQIAADSGGSNIVATGTMTLSATLLP